MKLKKGHHTKFVILAAAAAWTIGAVLAASGPVPSVRPATPAGPPMSAATSRNLALVAFQAKTPMGVPPAGITAGKFFKNVTALPDVTVADFMETMGIMSASLSFCCNECHPGAGTDKVVWEQDTPRKRTARNMVAMVTAINRDNFNGRQIVTCWTCHRGKDFPPVTPSIEDDVYGTPIPATEDIILRAQGVPTADQIFDKYLTALGGAQKLNAITSYVAKANSLGFGGFGGGGDVTISAKAPNMRTTHTQFKPETGRPDVWRTFDGNSGWWAIPLVVVPLYPLEGNERDGAKLDAMLGFPGQIKTVLQNWKVGTSTYISDKEVYPVQGVGTGGFMATLYFDKQTGLLRRVLRYTASPIGRVPTQQDILEFKDVGNGMKLPSKWIYSWLDGRDTIEVTNYQLNANVDNSVFGRPPVK